MLSVNRWVRDNRWVRQLSLFDRATTASMRDRTRSRNYSPERDEFRREHERRRYWGLKRRHAEKLRRIHDGPTPPATPAANDDQSPPPPPAVPATAAATPPPVSPDPAAPAPRPARPRVDARPAAAASTAPQSAIKKRIQRPRGSRRYSTPPVRRGQQFHGGHETYAISSITRNFAHPQKARAPPISAHPPRGRSRVADLTARRPASPRPGRPPVRGRHEAGGPCVRDTPAAEVARATNVVQWQADPHRRRAPRAEERKRHGSHSLPTATHRQVAGRDRRSGFGRTCCRYTSNRSTQRRRTLLQRSPRAGVCDAVGEAAGAAVRTTAGVAVARCWLVLVWGQARGRRHSWVRSQAR